MDDWEKDMDKLKARKTDLLGELSETLNSINDHNDDFAQQSRSIVEELISNAASQNLMYR
ncbi:hypothetical protein N6G95_09595 [Pediococcus inopinatus]|uniref:hypothetical protein n=1 Tax=Pediococcus inopinatus TaxID=114090 RepID=UPI002B261706|nr:hypothetical protein [Pediococcus inopinatus]WPC19456.1 hypothetical protein N6G95_09595 [Pediococcus inopinatus]